MSGAPFKLSGLDHVVLRVDDIEKALSFYRDVLGAAVERKIEKLSIVQLRVGQSIIDLVDVHADWLKAQGARPFAPEAMNVDHICIRIEPFDEQALEDYLRAHKVEIGERGIRYGAEGNGPSIYVRDPFGNTVELKGPATPIEADGPVLRTARLILRPTRREDAAALLPIFQDADAMRYWSHGPIEGIAQMQEIIARNLPPRNKPKSSFAITLGGRVIGCTNIYREEDAMAGLGYIVERRCWGQGYVSEAVDAMVDHAFGTLHMHRLWLEIDPRNHGSLRVAEKCGFNAEGVAREAYFFDGAYVDSVFWSMLRGEWLKMRGLDG